MIWPRRKVLLPLFFYLVSAFARVSESSEWSVESTITAQELVNDNLLMTSGPHQTVWDSMVSPAVKFGLDKENFGLNGNFALTTNYYAGEEQLNTTDQSYNVLTRIDRTEQESWTLQGSYLVDSTLENELMTTGVVLQRTQRNNGSASVSLKRNLRENTDLQLSYQHISVNYADSQASLSNYNVDSGTTGITHQLTEKNQLNENLSYSLYRIPDQNYSSWNGAIQVGTIYSFSERLKGTFSGGFNQTGSSLNSLGQDIRQLNSGWVLNGELEGQTELTILHGGYSREVQISGGGSLVQVNHLFMDTNEKLTERMSISLGADIFMTLPFREELTSLKSNYGQVRGGLTWKWTENWELGAGYNYSILKNEANTKNIGANIAYLKMTYNIPKWSLSR
ncbi:MAG: hypothetical protein ACHQYP_10425 [Nitrospiria bacterium]